MGWNYKIDYEDYAVEVAPVRPIKKQIWDGQQFVEVTMNRHNGILTDEQKTWLLNSFGSRGTRWDYSLTGNFWVMDEQVYAWFQMKWSNK